MEIELSHADLERIRSQDGKRSNDRFRCTVCIEYGSDDELKTFTPNNKSAHLRTTKHRVSLKAHAQKLKEMNSVQERAERAQTVHSILLPMPEISSTPPAGPDDETSCVFKNFRRLGLAYLDENGEKLEFSAGNDANDNEGGRTQSEEDEALESDFSDTSESDGADAQPKRVVRDGGLGKYWPYPSKTVSENFRAAGILALTR
jgi:hypothetical protein